MILYRFFVLLYNTILDNKIYNLINAHEVQKVSLKNDGENGKLCQKIWRFDYFMLEAHELQCFMPTNDYHEGLR